MAFRVWQRKQGRKRLPFLVLDLGLDIIDRIGGLDLEGDGFASEGLNEDLHGVQVMATGRVWNE